ncbi:MAG: hypothetical protein FJX76_21215 [Armatimonadetes bacterium]|nr:hypothetical protein [Armatimonadota bacterium]
MKREVPASAAILTIVQQRAVAVMQEARDAADAIRKAAYDEGFRSGQEEGRRAAEQMVVERYRTALDEVQREQLVQEAAVRQWFIDSEPRMVEMVMEIAATVIKQQAEIDREMAVRQLRAALDALGTAAWARVRANPIDLPAISEADRAKAYSSKIPDFQVVGDESISPGGIFVEAPGARIDATIEMQLEQVRQGLQRAS